MKYSELRQINVNEQTEKKNGFTYLSWAWAVDVLLQHDETATWEYQFFGPEGDRRPYCNIGDGAMVFCTVTAFGRSRTAQMPVLNYANKPVSNPNSFDVNTAMMRGLAKAISLHGIGLYIYAGEDLPDSEAEHLSKKDLGPMAGAGDDVSIDAKAKVRDLAMNIIAALKIDNVKDAYKIANELENEDKIYLWSLLDSKQRSALKKYGEKVRQEGGHIKDHINAMKGVVNG